MSSVQLLIDQKLALESEVSRLIKAAEEKKKLLEEQIAKQRADEIRQGRAEIAKIMQRYNLSPEEAVGDPPVAQRKSGDSSKRSSYLADIRRHYSGRVA